MRLSKFLAKTIRDIPKDAELPSHRFMLRGGFMKQFSAGIYALLPLGMRSVSKIEKLCREEMNRRDGLEIKMPCTATKELWDETGRYDTFGKDMMKFKDRHEKPMVLNPTHEEPVVGIARTEITSYKQLPMMLYQIQTKFRDEPRPRGGLIRLREFSMKDGYSFHTSEEDLKKYYDEMHQSYMRFFKRCGCKNFVSVMSDNGLFGGRYSHEFQMISPNGEDKLLLCESCRYCANAEVAQSKFESKVHIKSKKQLSKVLTPNTKTIQDLCLYLKVDEKDTAKAVLFQNLKGDTLVAVFVRGDREVMDKKVRTLVGFEIIPATAETIAKGGAVPGFTGPKGLNLKTCYVVIDECLMQNHELITGANEVDAHYTHFSMEEDFIQETPAHFKNQIKIGDVTLVKSGDNCPHCTGGTLKEIRGIEIGNIFHLGTKYSKSMDCSYLDFQGKKQFPIMGCYGIGMTRLLPAIIEESYDERGPIFPIPVAPFEVHLCVFNRKEKNVFEASEAIYQELKLKNIDVLIDDRDEKPGSQFADADLFGIPFRILISPKTLQENSVELKYRDGREDAQLISLTEIVDFLQNKVTLEYQKYDIS